MTRTLADMTPEERQNCVGMWGDTPTITAVIASIVATTKGSMVRLYRPEKALAIPFMTLELVTPRFDLPRAWTPSGEPVPGEWEDGYICLDWEEPDMTDGHPHGPTEPVTIEGQSTGEMCYYNEIPYGLSVTMTSATTGEGEARRFITDWEAMP